ncbi:MAG: hypothetical protein OIN87_07465 [Candidatus Methanoperedens sp.]|nr:hypothetical protein [Candidatus Methanoperedens sp.]
MSVRKNISLENIHLKKLEPLVQKHNGNFSAAMREIIDLIDIMTKDPAAVNGLIDGLKTDYNLTENVFYWLIKQARGRLIDPEYLNSIIDPAKIVLLSDLEKYLDDMTNGASWQTQVKIEDYCHVNFQKSDKVWLTLSSHLQS